jgi:hypothetical protein
MVVQRMSDFVPNPEANPPEEPLKFDFGSLNAETEDAPTSAPDFSMPDPNGGKRKWWQGKAKAKTPKRPKAIPSAPRGGILKPLEELYTGIGLMMMPFDPSCGRVIIEAAPACAKSLNDMANTNPAVRRLLISLLSTSAMGAVVMAHAPIVMAIAMHHIPALKSKQEKMVADMAEMFANMPKGDQSE